MTPHPARLLQQENEELRKRLALATRRTEALERELEIGQDCLELELGQSREELDKFKDKFRRYGHEGLGHACMHLYVHWGLAGRGLRDHLIVVRKLKFGEENDLPKIPYKGEAEQGLRNGIETRGSALYSSAGCRIATQLPRGPTRSWRTSCTRW